MFRPLAMAGAVGLLSGLLFGGCSGEKDDEADTGFSLANLDFSHVDNVDVVPSKRSEVLAAVHEDLNKVMIFGGNEGAIVNQIPTATFIKDTWVFEPGIGWHEAALDKSPKRRGRYAVSVDNEGKRALLFGGRFRPDGQSGNYDLFNDVWEFDFVTEEWTLLDDGTNGGPAPRYYPASGYDESTDTFYIWGGLTNRDPLVFEKNEELWAFKDGQWEQRTVGGDPPSSRAFFGSAYDPSRNEIVLFGGQRGDFTSQAFQDFYALNLDSGDWRQLDDGRGRAPSTRMHGHLTYDPLEDRYLLFGGHTDIGDHNDLWRWSPQAGKWKEIRHLDTLTGGALGCLGNGSEVPADYVEQDLSGPERRHRGMFALIHNNIFISNGMHAECSNQLNDTWRYEIESDTWTELIEATTGESCARADRSCECLCL